jgi:mRNA interferase RelE/StbE
MKSKYLFQKHPKVDSEDFLRVPLELREDFGELYQPILSAEPYDCKGFPHHSLQGKLKDCRTLEIDWNGITYRLVYQIYESPAPKRVFVISFDEHNPAYEKAKARLGRLK